MITRVEPSGVILKDICEIQTEKCVAEYSSAAITAVWYSPGRKQVNVCRSCFDEMVRRGEWEVKGARLSPRPENMSLMTLYSELENIFRQQILDSYPSDWNEDFITRKIFFEYRKLFRNIQIDGLSSLPIKINSAAYKFTGNPERQFGDIGFIVKIIYPGSHPFEGVTSLEAKIRHKTTRKFAEIKGKQLNIISSNVKYPMLLMYDYQPIEKFHDYSFFPSTTKRNHAVVVPVDIVESIIREIDPYYPEKDKNHKISIDGKSIYKFTVPLAYQILFRYFRGLDLDFNQNLIRSMKGYENEEFPLSYNLREAPLPQYLLLVNVNYGDSETNMEFDINTGIFREITSSEEQEFDF
ncbi:hypothetical protein ACSQ6I_16960 [Anabaena sp. WFMT]|uniref:hypothetical protein n=1 Tax=Anabaena sp. WFMT TaxID=3449730 RepID=UPI003F24926D